ncbi:hypothetical protein [Sphingomonas faeni]|uniref:hypothetical protein n=1 Tax=Sphingomonas faeni TaxID=185950 RepID=UPI0024130855|nr:hypothetical protein [Sphingomonas faeni]
MSQASRTVEPGISHRPRHVEQQGLGDFEIDDVAGLTSGCQQASGGKAVFLYPLSFAGEGEPASQDFGNEVLVVEPQRIEGLVRRCGHFCVALRGADNRCGHLRGVRTSVRTLCGPPIGPPPARAGECRIELAVG